MARSKHFTPQPEPPTGQAPRERPERQRPTVHPPPIVPPDARHTGRQRRSARSPEDEIVYRLNAAAHRHRWAWPFTLLALAVGGILAYVGDIAWVLIEWALAIPILVGLIARDTIRRRVVVRFDLEGASEHWFAELLASWNWLLESRRLWRVVDRGSPTSTRQRKSNAGATDLVDRWEIRVSLGGPRQLKTNVDVPTIEAGSSAVYFLPDQMLLRERRRYVGVDYRDVRAEAHEQRFAEKLGRTPSDAEQVDSTWLHANADGTRDKRFTDNPAVPIVAYGALELSIPPANRWCLHISRAAAAPVIAAIVNEGAIINGR